MGQPRRRARSLSSTAGHAGDGARRAPSGVDAIVAAHATDADRAVVLTTDPGDLRRLLADRTTTAVERV